MNQYFILKKINIFIICLALLQLANLCFAMNGSDYENEEEINEETYTSNETNNLILQLDEASDEYINHQNAFDRYKNHQNDKKSDKDRLISREHKKLGINISDIHNKIQEIDKLRETRDTLREKINKLKLSSELQKNKPQKKEKTAKKRKKHRRRTLSFQTIKNRLFKLQKNDTPEQRLDKLKRLLYEEHTLNLTKDERAELGNQILELNLDADLTIFEETLCKQIETAKKILENLENYEALLAIRQAEATNEDEATLKNDGWLSPRLLPSQTTPRPKIKRANTSDKLPIHKEK